ncbi:glycosyltransferase family 2 protein [Amylibacter sp.]|nr:glycosyltransferase family 2 protein [Amylibacter sp.]
MILTVIILTMNEEQHIARAIGSVKDIADRIIVVDSGSSDTTCEIALLAGAEVMVNPFINQAQQFNWALEILPVETNWVLRLDADEFVSDTLAKEISTQLLGLPPEVNGVTLARRIAFMGKPIRYGGLFPIHVIRLLRHGFGKSEDRWMDEHILIEGDVVSFKGELIDDNLKPLCWWIEKHNAYASREVLQFFYEKYGTFQQIHGMSLGKSQTSMKRWIKGKIYLRLPGGFRAFLYFIYRYVLCFGFLDGRAGTAFHVLQGFWYRYIIDLRIYEVEKYSRDHGCEICESIEHVLGIKLDSSFKNHIYKSTKKSNN